MPDEHLGGMEGQHMSAIFNKLNLKSQTEILVLNAPENFEPELAALENVAIRRNEQDIKEIAFSLAFVTKQREVDAIAKIVARKATGDDAAGQEESCEEAMTGEAPSLMASYPGETLR